MSSTLRVLLFCFFCASGCAHRPSSPPLRMPEPPRVPPPAADADRAERRADEKVAAVLKQLERNRRAARAAAAAEQPVGELGSSTDTETATSTSGSLPPRTGWSSVVSTPMAHGAPGEPAASSADDAPQGGSNRPRVPAAAAFAVAGGLIAAVLWLPRRFGARR